MGFIPWTTGLGLFAKNAIISYALNTVTAKIFGPKQQNNSPTYSVGPLQTQTNSEMVMPVIYGKVKLSGNNIWQSGEGTTVQRIVSFGVGKCQGVTDVRLNDILIGELPGCSYTAYMGDGDQLIDDRVTGATQRDKSLLVGGLKYDAYLAITITAGDKLSGNPNVTALWSGRIVKTYTTPTTYTEAWSDNPAWCILDFYTSMDGAGIPVSEIDIQSFITAAAYFQPGDGTRHYSINLVLDEKKSRQDWLVEMMACCRSYPTYQRGKYGILVDKPESVSQVFTVKPTEEMEMWSSEINEVLERIIIKYPDPEYEWVTVGAPVTAAPPFRNPNKPLEKTIEVNGITNFKQASQNAWFHLNQAQTCRQWIRYKTNKRAMNRSVGDVIGIYDPITQVTEPGLVYKRYRIMSMTEPQGGSIELVCREYNPAIYTDQLGSVAPVINIASIANPYTAPPLPVAYFASQNFRQLEHAWSVVSGATAEIRKLDPNNPSWDAGQVVETNLPGNKHIDLNISIGNLLYGIKTKNKNGIYSESMLTASVAVSKIYASNYIVAKNFFDDLSGTLTNCVIDSGYIVPVGAETLGETFAKMATMAGLPRWGDPAVSQAIYAAGPFDLGKIMTSIVQLDLVGIASEGATARAEWRYSADDAGEVWTGWTPFVNGSYTFRHHDWRIYLETASGKLYVLTGAIANIDVPDYPLKFIGLQITDANAGIEINFNPPYIEPPAVGATPVGVIARPVATRDRYHAVVKLYDKNDVAITGTVDVQTNGY